MATGGRTRDAYEVLGVGRDADDDEIRGAYRRLARQYHPDINKDPGAEDRFKEVSEAYDNLRDPESRAQYDRGGFDPSAAGWGRARPGPGAGRGGGAGGGVRMDFDGDFGDIFGDLFGGRGRGGFGGMRGADQEAVLELSLEEAARGGRKRITLGDGRDFEVEIPAGVRDGQRIRLSGQGGEGPGGTEPGDLLLRVRLRPHPVFRVEGRDLEMDLRLAPWEAALGTSVSVPTLQGDARLTVPEGSSSGRRMRLRGEGLPGPDGRRGDLYAVVRIMVPPRPTAQERELFERLAEVSDFDPRAAR
jgi:curved DNA-binding protein